MAQTDHVANHFGIIISYAVSRKVHNQQNV